MEAGPNPPPASRHREAALVAAAQVLAANPAARAEALAVAADFLAEEDEALQGAVAGEQPGDEDG